MVLKRDCDIRVARNICSHCTEKVVLKRSAVNLKRRSVGPAFRSARHVILKRDASRFFGRADVTLFLLNTNLNSKTMARPARARAQPAQQSLYADSDSDVDENDNDDAFDLDATPRAGRKGATKGRPKKRVSEAYHHSEGAAAAEGGSSSPQRVPFMTVNINDDEAEKRRRRKSAKITQPMMLVDDAEVESGKNDTPRASRHLKHKQQLMAVAETPHINVPLDVMSSNFEEWMKMATDNVS